MFCNTSPFSFFLICVRNRSRIIKKANTTITSSDISLYHFVLCMNLDILLLYTRMPTPVSGDTVFPVSAMFSEICQDLHNKSYCSDIYKILFRQRDDVPLSNWGDECFLACIHLTPGIFKSFSK